MRRPARLAAAVLGVAALLAPLWGPPLLARTDWFPVERVEVAGTRLVPPHEVLAVSGIRSGTSLWTAPDAWEAKLATHPAILDARISRRFPDRLRIDVREKRAVGLVQVGTLRPVTSGGEMLPAEPSRVPMDLPIVRLDGDALSAPRSRRLLAELGRLDQLDAGLLARVSEVEWRGESLMLTLSSPHARVRVPVGVGSSGLLQLRATLDDLSSRAATELRRPGAAPVDIDLRFRDQVVVRFPSRA